MIYLDNSLSINWLTTATVAATTTATGVDLVNAIGPVGINVKIPSGGTGTLAIQPVHSDDNSTFVNVPAADILDPITGLATTFTNVTSTGNGANGQTVYLKRDDLKRYVSLTYTPVVSASQTVNSYELHVRPYTSQAV